MGVRLARGRNIFVRETSFFGRGSHVRFETAEERRGPEELE